MAYIPEKIALSETLASNYNLVSGSISFASSDISEYNRFSIQFVGTSIAGEVNYCIEQSNDNTNWDVFENADLAFTSFNSNFTIERNGFNGKHVRVRIKSAKTGTLSLYLVAKR